MSSPDNPIPTPRTLDHLIGQRPLVESLRVAVEAAFADNRRFEHTLMVGPPGLGKTLVASVIAKEMASHYIEVLGQTLDSDGGLQGLLLELEDRDTILIDEAHGLSKDHQTLLYRAMEQRQLFVSVGSGRKKAHSLPLADFTLIAATTDEYALLPPLRDRFKLVLRFDYYSADEIELLLHQRLKALRWPTDPSVIAQIAIRGRGTPRIAIRLLEACWRTARADGCKVITEAHFKKTLRLEGMDDLGLTAVERQFMAILAAAGTPVRLNVLSTKLGLPPQTVAQVVEPFLLREGLIDKTSTGRLLTAKGLEHLQKQPPAHRARKEQP